MLVSSSAPNSPAQVEAQFQGEVRSADGYQYWTTSPEDEEAADFGDMAKRADLEQTPVKVAKTKRGGAIFKRIMQLFMVLLLALIAYVVFSFVQVYQAADDDQTRDADAIVVLGAAQLGGNPSPVFAGRLEHAFELWEAGNAPLVFTTGSNQPGDDTTEGSVGYDYLRRKGMPESALVRIIDGDNTYEQLTASALQLQERDIETVLLVSDGYHNYRLLDIADEAGLDAHVAPTGLDPTINNYIRETVAVSVGQIFGYRRLSNFTSDG